MYTPNLDFKTKVDQIQINITKDIDNIEFLNDVYRLYKEIDKENISTHYVGHSKLEIFCNEYDKFYKSLDIDDKQNDILHKAISFLARYRFKVTKIPLPLNHSIFLNVPISEFSEIIKKIEFSFPHYYNSLLKLFDKINELIKLNDNPLFEKLINNFKQGKIYIPSGENYFTIKKYIEENSSNLLQVASGKELSSKKISKDLCIIGYPSWISKNDLHIFSAPKFENLHLVLYDFPNFNYKSTPQLKKPLGLMNIPLIPHIQKSKSSNFLIADNPDEHVEEIHLDYYRKKFSTNTDDGEIKNLINCRLCVLKGGNIVYLANEKGYDEKQDSLELDDNGNIIIEKKHVADLIRGSIILLRIGSSESLIVETADKIILKEKAFLLRNAQKDWKLQLANTIQKYNEDLNVIITLLKEKGINHANKSNIRNWLSSRNIMLGEEEKFLILLSFIGYDEKKARQICDYMRIIDSSHNRASSDIRKKLLKLVRENDLEILQQQGWQEFELEDTGAKMGLFTVQAIEEKNIMMPHSMCDRPLSEKELDG